MQARHWCFTLNNPDGQLPELWTQWSHIRYAVAQLEEGASGTPHWQGYVEYRKPKRLAGVRKDLPGAHWEPAMGSRDSNVAYCTKDDGRKDGPWTYGEPETEQGRRNDLGAIKELLDSGASTSDVADKHFASWVRYRDSFGYYAELVRQRTRSPPQRRDVVCIVGPPGSGKTTLAEEIERLSGEPAYWWSGDQWFPDYAGNRVMVLDEFRGGLAITFLLRLLDPKAKPLDLPIKGGHVRMLSHLVVITSNLLPEQWYDPKYRLQLEAIGRRIGTFIWLERNEEACWSRSPYAEINF